MLKKVKSGDPPSQSLRRTGPLKIPAATFNAFVNAAAKAIVKKPVAVYIEKVYDLGDFSALGIGT